MVTFQPKIDMRKVLQLHKLCHCIVKWEKYKNSRPIRQCFNCQFLGTHQPTAVDPPSASNATNSTPRKIAPNQPAPPQNALTAEGNTQQTSLVAPNIYNLTTYNGTTTHNNGRVVTRRHTTHLSNTKNHSSPNSRRVNLLPLPTKHGPKSYLNPRPNAPNNPSVQS